MSDGTRHKDERASFPDQGRDAFRKRQPCLFHRRLLLQGLAGVILLPVPLLAQTPSTDHPFIRQYPWMRPWVASGEFDPAWLAGWLGKIKPDPRVVHWMDRQAEAKPYHHYRKLFVTDTRIRKGKEQRLRQAETLAVVEKKFQVSAPVVVALWGIESNYGTTIGRYSVLRTLFTLSTLYPRRAEFFRRQLRYFLLLCRKEGFSPDRLMGSYAGAMGQVQMIPETLHHYAVDFDGDGRRDVFHSTADVLASIASFLHGHGWEEEGLYTLEPVQNPNLEPLVSSSLQQMKPWRWWQDQGVALEVGASQPHPETLVALIKLEERDGVRYHLVFNNFRVITRWNRSVRFAMVVHELAQRFG